MDDKGIVIMMVDESMSAYRPQTAKTGNLPHLSHIIWKPEDLGTEFKVTACSVTGMLLHLEIQEGKDRMKQKEHADKKKATAACCMQMSEASRRVTNKTKETKDEPTHTFLGDSWFLLSKLQRNWQSEGITTLAC